jgi:hypothetical protein
MEEYRLIYTPLLGSGIISLMGGTTFSWLLSSNNRQDDIGTLESEHFKTSLIGILKQISF